MLLTLVHDIVGLKCSCTPKFKSRYLTLIFSPNNEETLVPKLLARPLKYEVTLFSKLEAFEILIKKKILKIEQI